MGAGGVPDGGSPSLFEGGVTAVKARIVDGKIRALLERAGHGESGAPEALVVIGHVVQNADPVLDQPKRARVPHPLAGLKGDADAVHAAAQVQTFRRRNQASASETQLRPAEAQRNGSRFGANNLPIEEGHVQNKRVATGRPRPSVTALFQSAL